MRPVALPITSSSLLTVPSFCSQYLAAEIKYETSLVIQLFAPYWLINKTKLPLQWKAVKVSNHPNTKQGIDVGAQYSFVTCICAVCLESSYHPPAYRTSV